ncbi:uncharacterized oxidoreductase Tda5p [[Candida] anglica]
MAVIHVVVPLCGVLQVALGLCVPGTFHITIDSVVSYFLFRLSFTQVIFNWIIFQWVFPQWSIWFILIALSMILGRLLVRTVVYVIDRYNQRGGPWAPLDSKDVALVTGGSRGLGMYIVQRLHARGVGKIIVLDIAAPKEVSFPSSVELHICDVAQEQELKLKLSSILATNKVSILVNNAGVDHRSSLLDMHEDELVRVFNINMFAQIWALRSVIRAHLHHNAKSATGGEPRRLFVVSVSSILGTLAPRNLTVYSASKAAVIQLHEGLSQELKDHVDSLRFLLATPGQLDTGMFGDISPSNSFLAPVVKADELASQIVSRIEKGHAGVISMPLYASLLPMVKCMPTIIQDFCRWFSDMDNKIKQD